MKASFVVTLLTLCLGAEAAELPHFGNALSFQTPRDTLAAALDPTAGPVSNPVSTQNTSHFYPIIEYGYVRNGATFAVHYGVSIEECIEYCRNSDSCLAVNYHESARYCYEKSTLSSFSTSTTYSTCLVNYKDGEDPCDSAYMHSGRTRSNFYYRYYPRGVIATPKDCCVECRQDSESKCKAWTYNTSGQYCYLLDGTPPSTNVSGWTTGYAVIDPDNE